MNDERCCRSSTAGGVAESAGCELASGIIRDVASEEKRVALDRTRVAFARMVATKPHLPWVTEEADKARRPRHLLEDNPASG